ncbi:MAG: TolC family protein [Paracoccaceae bacterium]
MTIFRAPMLTAALLVSACAAFPELDGKPVAATRAVEFQASGTRAGDAPVWALDFGDSALRRMLAEADRVGLDAASARARFRAADLALDQVRAGSGPGYASDASAERGKLAVNASLRFEPDLAGRFDAALRAATLEHSASGLDLMMARRTLAREITQGWVALAEARGDAIRAGTDIAAEENALRLLRLRRDAGEITGADLAARDQAVVRARADAAGAAGRVALAEARLRALGVQKVPPAISLKRASRPAVPARTDLAATQATAPVCAAWLRFRAADASRAEALAAARPRLVVTSSLSATAKTLAGLIAGNAVAVTNSVRIEGNILDNGQSRRTVDRARLAVAQAEIEWMQARNRADISALEAVTARQSAEAGLDAALSGWRNARADLDRVRARQVAGVADALDLAEAERGLTSAQQGVDRSRAEAFRAAAALHDALPPVAASCTSATAPVPAQTL